ncbi:LacI family DNA-binding transcriptional regulator [Microbacterium sp. 179-I 3D4 NHS]|uniref:LacI family DNA-binding transcriptional regulator n=1 Tax=Microbacterium sp. 179-I 3D4 NHS TaxID=3142381 RepID=UPI0039A3ED87
MASIDDVARAAGVSTATVSRTLSGRGTVSEATRRRVLDAASALGYVVSSRASGLASGRTRNIGVIVPYLDRWFFSTVLSGVSAALMRVGYDITLYNITADRAVRREVFDTFLRRQGVDAVIAVSIKLDEDETRQLLGLGLPVIAIGGPHPTLDTLSVDELAVARLATEHLLALGHRDIVYLGAGPEFDDDFHVPTNRRHGFEQALVAAGVPLDPTRLLAADFTIEGGHRAATALLAAAGRRPTAVFAASDEMAIGTILAARDLGLRVPEDLSVIGIDGHELGAVFGLTTVDQYPLQQGERAAAAALARLGEGDEPGASLPFELTVRGSTARV